MQLPSDSQRSLAEPHKTKNWCDVGFSQLAEKPLTLFCLLWALYLPGNPQTGGGDISSLVIQWPTTRGYQVSRLAHQPLATRPGYQQTLDLSRPKDVLPGTPDPQEGAGTAEWPRGAPRCHSNPRRRPDAGVLAARDLKPLPAGKQRLAGSVGPGGALDGTPDSPSHLGPAPPPSVLVLSGV